MENKTELALRDLKKQHRAVQNQIVFLERDHLFTYLPSEVKDSLIESYIATEQALQDGIHLLEVIVESIKINQGLGIRN